MVSPQARREAVGILTAGRGLGVTRACGLVGISRSLYGYRSRLPPALELRNRIAELAAQKRRYGYRRIQVLLRREGWSVNHKKTYRLYREQGLAVRKRKRKRIGIADRRPLPTPSGPNQSGSMDYVADGLIDGRKLRVLAIVDDYSRECLALEVDTSLPGPCGGGSRALGRASRVAAFDHGRPRPGVRGPGARCLGVQARGAACVHSPRKADRERLRRELQRPLSR